MSKYQKTITILETARSILEAHNPMTVRLVCTGGSAGDGGAREGQAGDGHENIQRGREMKEPTEYKPTVREIFFFDCGRSYQVGVFMGMWGQEPLNERDFPVVCRAVVKRYTKGGDLTELYRAYCEGYERGKTWKDEMGGITLVKGQGGMA